MEFERHGFRRWARGQMFERARDMRKAPTRSEALLWEALRNRNFENVKFRRQQPIGMYIVDFYAAEQKLAVEVDGDVHEPEYDRARDAYLATLGIRVLRLDAELVEHDLRGALERIRPELTVDPGRRPRTRSRGTLGT